MKGKWIEIKNEIGEKSKMKSFDIMGREGMAKK